MLKLSEVIKHNKQYINFSNPNRSKQDTIKHYTEHYTEPWTLALDIDMTKEEVKNLLEA